MSANTEGEQAYWESFKRNIGILTKEDQQRLKDCCIAIAGTGGVGGIYMATLARVGVGKFVISDPDTFGRSNINRQYGATVDTIGRNKAAVMKEITQAINPSAEVRIVEGGLTEGNMEEFLEGCALVLDSLDAYTFVELVKLHKAARQRNLYVIKGIPLGFGATLLVFSPKGMSLCEHMKVNDKEKIDLSEIFSDIEKVRGFHTRFLDVYSPSRLYLNYLDPGVFDPFDKKGNFTSKAFSSFCPSVHLCSALVTTEAVLIYLRKREPIVVPKCLQVDLFECVLKISEVQ